MSKIFAIFVSETSAPLLPGYSQFVYSDSKINCHAIEQVRSSILLFLTFITRDLLLVHTFIATASEISILGFLKTDVAPNIIASLKDGH